MRLYPTIFGFNLVAVLRTERSDGSLLSFQAKTAAALVQFAMSIRTSLRSHRHRYRGNDYCLTVARRNRLCFRQTARSPVLKISRAGSRGNLAGENYRHPPGEEKFAEKHA
jgi:hypothetical protein